MMDKERPLCSGDEFSASSSSRPYESRVRDVLSSWLPHRALLCGQYAPHAAGYAVIQRHAFGLPNEYLTRITVAGQHVRSPILTRLINTGKPQYFSLSCHDCSVDAEWKAAFVQAGWQNILGLIWRDSEMDEAHLTVAAFYDVPQQCSDQQEALQAQVMPFLHAKLKAERDQRPWLQAREHHLNWTPAQRAVAQHVAQGLTTKQIARALGKSDQTVKEQLSSMMQKAGVRTRTALAIRLVAEQHRVSE